MNRFRFRGWGRSVAPLALLLLLIVYPLAVLLTEVFFPSLFGFHPEARFTTSVLTTLFRNPEFWTATRNSVFLGVAVALAATAGGTAVGFLLTRARPHYQGFWTQALWLLFFTPSFMIAEGISLFAIPGGVGSALGVMPIWLSHLILSPYGVWAVLTLKFLPYPAIVVASALEGIGQEHDDAARSLGASRWQRLWVVQLGLVRRAVLAGIGIVFAEAVSDFGISATLAASSHFLLIPYAIYTSLGFFPPDFAGAAAQSFLLVGLSLLVQAPQMFLSSDTGQVLHGQRRQWRQGKKSWAATVVLVLFFLGTLGVPVLTYVLMAITPAVGVGFGPSHWTLVNFEHLWTGIPYTGEALIRSYVLALASAALVTTLGLWIMWAGKRLSALYDLLLTATIAIPGIVMAAAYVLAFDAPWFQGSLFSVYGTVWALVFVYIAGGLPFAGRLARVGLGQVHQSLLHAVHTLGGNEWTALRRVVLPLVRPVILSTFLLMFTGVFFELPASQLLYPPGQPTLAVAILHQFHSFQNGLGAALSVVAVMGVAFTLGLFRLLDRLTADPWRAERMDIVNEPVRGGSLEVVRTETHPA